MTNRRTVLAVCALLVLASGLSVAGSSIGTATTTSISVGETPTEYPSDSITVAPGDDVTVVIWANATNVSAYQANLTFDPAVVQVASISGTADFDAPVTNTNNGAGWIAFNQLRSSEASNPALVEITFTVADGASGTSNVSFVETEVKFATQDGETFAPSEFKNVTLQIGDSTSTPTPTSQPGTGPGPLNGFENAPTDPDGDGKYEDVNGDGDVNVGDAQAIFANTDDPVVQNNQAAFDFNNDGSVNVGDAQALFANEREV